MATTPLVIPATTTNVLAIPLATMTVDTGRNEDWVESIVYRVGDSTIVDINTLPQLDLRGIEFEMEVRRRPEDHEVILTVSTALQNMFIGAFPNIGFLIWNVSAEDMQKRQAGSYVADVIARAGNHVRKIIQMDLTIVEGITR